MNAKEKKQGSDREARDSDHGLIEPSEFTDPYLYSFFLPGSSCTDKYPETNDASARGRFLSLITSLKSAITNRCDCRREEVRTLFLLGLFPEL